MSKKTKENISRLIKKLVTSNVNITNDTIPQKTTNILHDPPNPQKNQKNPQNNDLKKITVNPLTNRKKLLV